MIKHIKLLFLAVATVLVGASQARANEPVPVHVVTLYSDATYQTVVGHIYPEKCLLWPMLDVLYYLEGTYTQYAQNEVIGYCDGTGEFWGPISN